MRAAVLWKVGDALEVRDDVQLKDPGPNEVRVRIAASGICHSDVSIQNGTVDQPLPSVLGHEGAGEVLEVGVGVDRLAPGDHVVLNWNPPCGMCAECLGGQANLCYQLSMHNPAVTRLSIDKESVHSLTGLGTFAEEVVVPHQAVIKIPSDIPLDIAALVGCGVMTGAGAALNTAKVQPGSSVAVIGCGGVGISVLQGARICGAAEIVAVDLNPEKREFAKKFGATHTASPDELPEVSAEVTGGRGFDYAFEAIGLPETMRLTYDTARRGGTAVIVGMAKADAMVHFSGYELVVMERKLLGSLYGSGDVRRDFNLLLRLWRAGRLDLEGMISKRLDLSQVNDGMDACSRGEVIRSVIEFN